MITRYGSLAVFLLLTVLTAAAAAGFEAGTWYYTKMTKPGWAPPAWMLAAAWAAASLFAAAAAWRVWLTEHFDRIKALGWWVALLLMNVLWSFLYFGLHRPGWAWIAATLAVVLTVLCMRGFKRLSDQATGLMIPYLLWIAFTWLLNFTTWTLNGGLFARFFS